MGFQDILLMGMVRGFRNKVRWENGTWSPQPPSGISILNLTISSKITKNILHSVPWPGCIKHSLHQGVKFLPKLCHSTFYIDDIYFLPVIR